MDFLSGLVSQISYWQSYISTSDLAYITAAAGALTVVLAFFKRIRKVVSEFLVTPIADFFGKFNSLNKRVANIEKTVYSKDFHERLTNMEKILTKIEESMGQIQNGSAVFQKQVKKLEAFQKSILNISQIPTFESDSNGACVFANRAALQLVGRSFDELKNFGWLNMIHPDDRQKVKDEWNSAIRDNRNFELTFRVVCKDKIVYSVFCESRPICGEGEGYIGHYQDIKEIGKI